MYLLDTNAWITHFRSRGVGKLSKRLAATPKGQIVTCAVVEAELFTGAFKSNTPGKNIADVKSVLDQLHSFPFETDAAEIYAKIRSELESQGNPIGSNDYMIAAIAVKNGAIVVTHNTREFSRVAGLSIEDWQ